LRLAPAAAGRAASRGGATAAAAENSARSTPRAVHGRSACRTASATTPARAGDGSARARNKARTRSAERARPGLQRRGQRHVPPQRVRVGAESAEPAKPGCRVFTRHRPRQSPAAGLNGLPGRRQGLRPEDGRRRGRAPGSDRAATRGGASGPDAAHQPGHAAPALDLTWQGTSERHRPRLGLGLCYLYVGGCAPVAKHGQRLVRHEGRRGVARRQHRRRCGGPDALHARSRVVCAPLRGCAGSHSAEQTRTGKSVTFRSPSAGLWTRPVPGKHLHRARAAAIRQIGGVTFRTVRAFTAARRAASASADSSARAANAAVLASTTASLGSSSTSACSRGRHLPRRSFHFICAARRREPERLTRNLRALYTSR